MSVIDAHHFITEIKNNIASKDLIKARILIKHFPEVDEVTRNRALFELSRGEDDFSLPLLAYILARARALNMDYLRVYSILLKKLMDYPEAIMEILQDGDIPDKKPFIELAGQVQCRKALPLIVTMLNQQDDPELNRLCLLAIGNIGDEKYITTLSDFLYSGNRELTLAAIQALKNIGTTTAVEYLVRRLGTDHDIDKMIVDSLGEIQTTASIRHINNLLVSHDAYIRNYAKDKLTELASKAVPVLLENLNSDNPDLLIHTLNILSLVGDPSSAQPIRKFLFNQPADANVRFAAYEALGMLPVRSGAFTLIEGLSDPEEQVQMACAKALNRNVETIILAGIQNLIQEDNEESKKIVSALINSESDRLFEKLIDFPPFQKIAMAFLADEASGDIRRHFIELLRKTGHAHLASRLMEKGEETAAGLKIYVVDDSRMILKVFKSTLHKLGYSAQLFEFPESALDTILQEKPDLVFTDLNMPGMNGVELTRRIRETYSKDQLPVIMVTTQQDMEDRKAALNAGVSAIIYKPFTAQQLQTEINAHMKN